MSRILVVDDEPSISWGLSRLVRGMGHTVDVAASAEELVRSADTAMYQVKGSGKNGIFIARGAEPAE